MSNENQNENEKKVVITPDDAKAAFEFWNQYDVPVIPGLKEAFDRFCTSPTFDNQEALKYLVMKSIVTTDHEAFKDESFKPVLSECRDVYYEMNFEKDFENIIGEDTSVSPK